MKNCFILLLLFLAYAGGFPQDTTGTVVSLNDKIGPTIDLEERNFYGMFMSYPDFESATLMKRPDSSYAFKVITRKGIGQPAGLVWIPITEEEIGRIRSHVDRVLGSGADAPPESEFFSRNDSWRFTLAEGRVILKMWILKLKDDSLKISDRKHAEWIHIDSISEIRKTRKSHFLTGTAIGVFAGVVIGSVDGAKRYKKPPPDELFSPWSRTDFMYFGGFVGGVIGLLLGGIIFEIIVDVLDKDEVYDFSESNHEQKITIIKNLILKGQSP